MINFENVTKRYGAARRQSAPALRDISLSIPRGDAYAVVGPNGSGKSTLFALTLGFLRPTTGTVTVDDATPRDYARRRGAGYLPERFTLPPAWRVREALHAFARIDGEPVELADRALERWGLTEHSTKELGALSHGLRQRVGLAQAFLAPRELVMLDEPHEGLDPLWRVQLREAVLTLRAEGRTVVIASHDLAEVERMTDRAVLLDDGGIRDILETAAPATPTHYRIRLAAPSDGFRVAFDVVGNVENARAASERSDGVADGDANGHASRDAVEYDVEVRDADELSARLAAAIAGGARVVAVEPHHDPLETRVRRALGEEAQ